MKSIKGGLFAMALALGMCSAAQADLQREFTYSLPHDTPKASYNEALRHFDGFTRQTFFNCIGRVEGQHSGTINSGDFMITFNLDKTATISWNFTETDHIFLGVYVAGGPGGGNLYENIPEMEGDEFKGTAEVDVHERKNGTLPRILHIDFFCGRGQPVPDKGTTLFLLASAMLGLILLQGRFSRGLPGY